MQGYRFLTENKGPLSKGKGSIGSLKVRMLNVVLAVQKYISYILKTNRARRRESTSHTCAPPIIF
jgi:hypothetical protein